MKVSAIESVPFTSQITVICDEFARNNGLACFPLYRGLPLWVMSDPDLIGRPCRRLQVIGYFAGENWRLRLDPGISIIVNDKEALVPKTCDPAAQIDFVIDHALDKEGLSDALKKIWESEKRFKATDDCPNDEIIVIDD